MAIRLFKTSFQSSDSQTFQSHKERVHFVDTMRANPFPFFVPSSAPAQRQAVEENKQNWGWARQEEGSNKGNISGGCAALVWLDIPPGRSRLGGCLASEALG